MISAIDSVVKTFKKRRKKRSKGRSERPYIGYIITTRGNRKFS
jgi:hypothetical protein